MRKAANSIVDQFVRERDEALLSLNRPKIEAYMRRWSIPVPSTDEAFWLGVHKARTAIRNFPEAEKRRSKDWLAAHGSSHMDTP